MEKSSGLGLDRPWRGSSRSKQARNFGNAVNFESETSTADNISESFNICCCTYVPLGSFFHGDPESGLESGYHLRAVRQPNKKALM